MRLHLVLALTKADTQQAKELQDLVEVEVRELINEFQLAGHAAEVVRLAVTEGASEQPELMTVLDAVG